MTRWLVSDSVPGSRRDRARGGRVLLLGRRGASERFEVGIRAVCPVQEAIAGRYRKAR